MSGLRVIGPSVIDILRGKQKTFIEMGQRKSDHSAASAGAVSTYTANLAKLVPAEALSLYALGQNVEVPQDMRDYRIWPVFCLAAAVAFRLVGTRGGQGTWPQIWAVCISAISFIIWIYAQADWFLGFRLDDQLKFLADYFLLFLTFVVPALVGSK